MFAAAFYTEQQVVTLYGIAIVLILGPLGIILAAITGYLLRKWSIAD